MDVMSLYTNMPYGEGIQCTQELLNSKRKNQLPSNENLIKLLKIVLKLNNFTLTMRIISKLMVDYCHKHKSVSHLC